MVSLQVKSHDNKNCNPPHFSKNKLVIKNHIELGLAMFYPVNFNEGVKSTEKEYKNVEPTL